MNEVLRVSRKALALLGVIVLVLSIGFAAAARLRSSALAPSVAVVGLVGYGVFAFRAMRLISPGGAPCMHRPPCWRQERDR